MDHLSATDQFYHSGGPFGENLYKAWGGSVDKNVIMSNAIKLFYDEIRYYDWNNPGFSMQTGHFTQVVWKASIEIGVGIATSSDSTYGHRSVVCISYRPPGNYQGQFPQNAQYREACQRNSFVNEQLGFEIKTTKLKLYFLKKISV